MVLPHAQPPLSLHKVARVAFCQLLLLLLCLPDAQAQGQVKIPNVVGMQLAAAQKILAQDKFLVFTQPSPVTTGTVVDIKPAPGKLVARGSKVLLIVQVKDVKAPGPGANKPPTPAPRVPNVVNMSSAEAQSRLKHLGLNGVVAEKKPTATRRDDIVAAQQPKEGEAPMPGGVVLLQVTEAVPVPNVTGKLRSQAEKELRDVELRGVVAAKKPTADPADTVISQKPLKGGQPLPGGQVELTIATAIWVPEVVRKPLKEAEHILARGGLTAVVEKRSPSLTADPDTVIWQTPQQGPLKGSDTRVQLTIAVPVIVPDVKHKSLSNADLLLNNVGLVYRIVDRRPRNDLAPDTVLSQEPIPGSRASRKEVDVVIAIAEQKAESPQPRSSEQLKPPPPHPSNGNHSQAVPPEGSKGPKDVARTEPLNGSKQPKGGRSSTAKANRTEKKNGSVKPAQDDKPVKVAPPPPDLRVATPDVLSKPFLDADVALKQAGLIARKVEFRDTSDLREIVLRQTPAPQTLIEKGGTVMLTVSRFDYRIVLGAIVVLMMASIAVLAKRRPATPASNSPDTVAERPKTTNIVTLDVAAAPDDGRQLVSGLGREGAEWSISVRAGIDSGQVSVEPQQPHISEDGAHG